MTKDAIKELFRRVKVWKRGAERAPHKPLLLLYALGRCSRGEERETPFREVDEQLSMLLAECGWVGSVLRWTEGDPYAQEIAAPYPPW
jgi:putative restriction endonuclease